MKRDSTALLPIGIVFVVLGLVGAATGNSVLVVFLAVGGALIGAAVRRATRRNRGGSRAGS